MNVGEQIKNHPLYAIATLLIAVIIGTWYLSEAIRVTPLKQEVAFQDRQIAELEKTVAKLFQDNKELNDRVASQGISKQSPAVITDCKNQNSELQKKIDVCHSNYNISRQIAFLADRKDNIDRQLRFTFRMPDADSREIDDQRRQSNELQAVFLVFRNALRVNRNKSEPQGVILFNFRAVSNSS